MQIFLYYSNLLKFNYFSSNSDSRGRQFCTYRFIYLLRTAFLCMLQIEKISRSFRSRLALIMLLCSTVLMFIILSLNNAVSKPESEVIIEPRTGLSLDNDFHGSIILDTGEHHHDSAMPDQNIALLKNDHLGAKLESLEAELAELKALLNMKTNVEGKSKVFPEVRYRNEDTLKRILITGGAGFVGSHLVDKLMKDGHEVIALDNYFTGRKRNVEQWLGHPNFELVHHDVVNPYFVEVDQIYHLASPASPPHYMYNPVKTIKTNTLGTINMLGLAKRVKATVLLASTSEIYGDPEVHPQSESYWGHVNTIGPRSCYDEGKRVAESLMVAYNKQEGVPIRIARIFNTFGPRMHMSDGRVVSNFIIQSLNGLPITIYGNGSQTRSFQYIDDLVDGLVALMNSNYSLPVNLGNPEEYTIGDFARIIRDLVGSSSEIVNRGSQQDDPQQRKPDIMRAAQEIDWQPKVTMHDGLMRTIQYFRHEIGENRKHSPTKKDGIREKD